MPALWIFDGLGGQPADLIHTLRRLYGQPENEAYFQVVHESVEAAIHHLELDAGRQLPDGLPLRAWLRGDLSPTPDALANSVVLGVLGHVYQLCHLQPPMPAGNAARPVVALGHSLGLQAAMIAALQIRRRSEFLEWCQRSVRLVAACLIRGHQTTSGDQVDRELHARYRRGGRPDSPGPMASVVGPRTGELRDRIDAHRELAGGTLQLGLLNSYRAHVVTGRTPHVLEFYFANEQWLTRERTTWSFLSSTAPFHNGVLAPAVERVARDGRELVGGMTDAKLRLPVLATDSPRNLQDSPDPFGEFPRLSMAQPLDWNATVTYALARYRPDRVVEFGPGPGAGAFTRDCLRASGRRLPYDSIRNT